MADDGGEEKDVQKRQAEQAAAEDPAAAARWAAGTLKLAGKRDQGKRRPAPGMPENLPPEVIRVPEDLAMLPEGAVRVDVFEGLAQTEQGKRSGKRPWGRRKKPTVARGARRRGRELAVQALYQCAASSGSMAQAIRQLKAGRDSVKVDLDYFERMAHGAWDRRQELDDLIDKWARRWASERIALIDRSVLRLGVYELLAEEGLAVTVIINEAVELSKRFGGQGSSRFVNGVLDGVAMQLRKQGQGHADGKGDG